MTGMTRARSDSPRRPGGSSGGSVCVVWQTMCKRWWKQSLSSHSKTNRLSSEGCTIAHWSARQWLTLRAPSGTCFLLLCNPGACFPICAAPQQLYPILPEGKIQGNRNLMERIPLWVPSPEQLAQQSVIPEGSSNPTAPVAFKGEAWRGHGCPKKALSPAVSVYKNHPEKHDQF